MDSNPKIISKKVNIEHYDILQSLRVKSYVKIKVGKHKASGKYVAIKMLKKSELMSLKSFQFIRNEITILQMIDHPFLVHAEGLTQDEKYLYIVLELVNGGYFFTYFDKMNYFPVEQASFYVAQLVLMIEYLHSKHIIYRNLKPDNLLIDHQGYLKLIGFEYVKKIENQTYTFCGTPEYLPPEIILNKGYGKAADWWILGICLYEMLAGTFPFIDEDMMELFKKITNEKVQCPNSFTSNSKSLVEHLLEPDPSKRYGNLENGVEDIKMHPFFQQIDWNLLVDYKINAPYKPEVSSNEDITKFKFCPDSGASATPINQSEDPFLDW